MNSIVTSFMSELHARHMKARGYKKTRFTYSRDRGSYVERVRLKGSPWNSAERPWSLEVELGVEFADLPKSSDLNFPNTHTYSAIEHIVDVASGQYSLQHSPIAGLAGQIMDRIEPSRQAVRVADPAQLRDEIAAHVELASDVLLRHQTQIRSFCGSSDYFDRRLAISRALGLQVGHPSPSRPVAQDGV